jgi:hypothetical protein
MWRAAFKQEPRPWARATAWPCLASRDLPTTLEPSSLTVGEAGDFKCLRDPPQAPCLRRPGLFSFGLHATGYNAIQRLPGRWCGGLVFDSMSKQFRLSYASRVAVVVETSHGLA